MNDEHLNRKIYFETADDVLKIYNFEIVA